MQSWRVSRVERDQATSPHRSHGPLRRYCCPEDVIRGARAPCVPELQRGMMKPSRLRRGSAALLLSAMIACDRILPERQDLSLPTPEEATEVYSRHGVQADVALSGNVVELRVSQDAR